MYIRKNHCLSLFTGLVFLFASQWAQAQDVAAKADSVRGYVTATNAQGQERQLKQGDSVYSGDTLNTAKRSRLKMKFTDGGIHALTANSQFKIIKYHFSGQQDGTEKAIFQFTKGSLESVSGQIGKRNKKAYKVATPMGLIGINGTSYKIELFTRDDGTNALRLSVSGGEVLYSAPGAPVQSVPKGNSLSQSPGQQPQTLQGLITSPNTLTRDGKDVVELIENLFDLEIITEADKEAALEAFNKNQGASASSQPEPEPEKNDKPLESPSESTIPKVLDITIPSGGCPSAIVASPAEAGCQPI